MKPRKEGVTKRKRRGQEEKKEEEKCSHGRLEKGGES